MYNGRYLTATEQNGYLLLTLTDEGREALAERDSNEFDTFCELFEDFLGNGWTTINPEDIGALTCCPFILAEQSQIYYDAKDNIERVDVCYWFSQYESKSIVAELLVGGAKLVKNVSREYAEANKGN